MPDGDQRPSPKAQTVASAAEGRLRIDIVDARGRRLRVPALARWLRAIAPARARGVVTLALVPDARIRELNRTFRGKDYATDVLSFPGDGSLGDIAIGQGVARRQARQCGHSELTELKILALHGLLHLLGYDHEQDNGAMRRVEQRLRRKGRLPVSLLER